MLRQAGVEAQLVPLVKKAVGRLNEELDAETTKFFAFEGEIIDERQLVDHTARQGAIQKTFELADVLRPRSDATGGARPVIVNVQWPNWCPPPDQKVNDAGDILTVSA